MLIAEEMVMLALDVKSGAAVHALRYLHGSRFLVAAVLIELAVQTRIGLRDNKVFVVDAMPSRHPMLTQTLQWVRKHDAMLDPLSMISGVLRSNRRIRRLLLEGLVRRDFLHSARRTIPFFGALRYPVRSTRAQNECLKNLRDAAVGERTDLRSIALLLLASNSGVLEQLLTAEETAEALSRQSLLREEINQELESNPELMEEQYSIALMIAMADAVGLALRVE
jgi:Golgi phosphoprotein 3 (GPP34)